MQGLPSRGLGVRELGLALPPQRMPLFRNGRPLKRWHYVGVYGAELAACVGDVRVGPLRQRFWAVAEPGRLLGERTSLRTAGVRLEARRVVVRSADVEIELTLGDAEAMEMAAPSGSDGYVWTRKTAPVPARGWIEIEGRWRSVDCDALIDETAGHHERHTAWRWSAGVGHGAGGERVAWNLVSGVNDAPKDSERTVWIDGRPVEVGPVEFAPDLSGVTFAEGPKLAFEEWAARENRTNLVLLRSCYRQPFGAFSGELPSGLRLAEGYGVMEEHDVWW
jgi:uncharacterized protein DUF2804